MISLNLINVLSRNGYEALWINDLTLPISNESSVPVAIMIFFVFFSRAVIAARQASTLSSILSFVSTSHWLDGFDKTLSMRLSVLLSEI